MPSAPFKYIFPLNLEIAFVSREGFNQGESYFEKTNGSVNTALKE